MIDVVIVGAGPAGLACALALRKLDLEIRVLERRRPVDGALDKVCGEGLMPDAVLDLERLGVDTTELLARPFFGIRYLDEALVAEGLSAEGHFPEGCGLGVRRTTLHRALVDRAQSQGVSIEWGRAVDALHPDQRSEAYLVESDGESLRPRILVAADGLRSGLRRAAGLERPPREAQPRFGIRRHFAVEPWSDLVEVHWAVGAEAYVTPLAERLVGVAILWRPGSSEPRQARSASARFECLLSNFPTLVGRLPTEAAVTPARGLGPLRQVARARARRNLFLVGDAAGYRDAITGEGMALAFSEAHALARVLSHSPEDETARRYDAVARRHERLPGALTELTLLLARRPRLRRRALRALAMCPSYFDRLLAVHARQRPVRGIGIGATLGFAAELMRPRDVDPLEASRP